MLARILFCLCLLLPFTTQAAETPALSVLWRDGDTLHWRLFDEAGRDISQQAKPPAETPLGSLWKLFVFAWLVENQVSVPDYVCTGADGSIAQRRDENAYCCPPGGAIGMDAALVRSCGPFFTPENLRQRLRQPTGDAAARPSPALTPDSWRDFWRQSPHSPPWLFDLAMMRPDALVSPESIIAALDAIPARARERAANVLLARIFDGSGAGDGLGRYMGGQLRVKTFSWHLPGDTNKKYGGGAGWLADGTPVWFAGFASGQEVMARYGKTLARALPPVRPEPGILAPGCVVVRLFARYPLLRVEKPGGGLAADGPLHGRFVAVFAGQGAALPFFSQGEISLATTKGVPQLTARLGLEDYVARVIDREADARETEAARALAVVIRGYLINSAATRGNCLFIDDSSRRQRVSPNPPSAATRRAAAFTTALVLTGLTEYHLDKSGENCLVWTEAVAMSRAKVPWDEILKKFYPRFDLRAMHDPVGIPCEAMPEAEQWLAKALSGWKARLYADLPGFEPPEPPQICRLAYGAPFSEQDRNRIHLREFRSAEDRVTLAHEYLHLALRHHPAGQDEALVERWARRLTLATPEQ